MELTVSSPPSGGPFEGDLTLELSALPVGARVTATTLTVRPIGGVGGRFEERLTLVGDTGDFGTTKTGPEVDFHTRRGLIAVGLDEPPSPTDRPLLQVDVGGLLLDVGSAGQLPRPVDDDGYRVPVGGALPGLVVSRFRLHGTGVPDVRSVTVRSVPSGLSARVGALPPFWTRFGELSQPFTTPDWAPVLTAALAEAGVRDGAYVLPLTVHSDTLCRLELTWTISYLLEVGGLPAGVTDVHQSFDHGSLALEGTPAAVLALPAGARVASTAGRLRGGFASSRVLLGPVGAVASASTVGVSGDRAQAQPLRCDQDVPADAIDLLLSTGADGADLQLQLLEDVDGRPWNVPLLPAPARLTLPGSRDPRPQWASAVLGERFRFRAGQRYWVLVQALTGSVRWTVEPVPMPATGSVDADPGLQWSQDGGLSWRRSTVEDVTPLSSANGSPPPLRALLRLRGAPPAFEVPAHLGIGAPARTEIVAAHVVAPSPTEVPLDRFRVAGRLDLSLDLPELAAAVQVASDTAPAPAPEVEHLVNGDFSTWVTVTHGDDDQHELPDVWQLTSGSVGRLEGSPGGQLGSETDRTALSQVVAVAPGAEYVLSVTTVGEPEAAADLIWRGGDCTGPRTDVLSLEPPAGIEPGNGRLPRAHRLRVTAPAAAGQVEVRLRTPANGYFTVHSVSLRADRGAGVNGDFREPPSAATGSGPAGWTMTPADGSLRLIPTQTLVALGTHGNAPLTLRQQIPVRAGLFRLDVTAFGMVPATTTGPPPPSLRLHWVADGLPLPVSDSEIAFSTTSFGRYLAQGPVPVGATAAELSLVLPAATPSALAWAGMSFSQPEPVEHPVNIITQAPGEVRVAAVAVRYDVPTAVPPVLGPAGACPVTPLEAVPGAPLPEPGRCPVCGRSGEAARTTRVSRWPAATGPVIPPPAVRTLPVDVVRNVGPVRAARLADAGLANLETLAAAPLDTVQAALSDLSVRQVQALVADAGERLAAGHRVRWADLQSRASGPRVTAIGGTTDDGSFWRMPATEAADGLAQGRWSLYVQAAGARIAVGLRQGGLRASRSAAEPDLLLSLPAIPATRHP